MIVGDGYDITSSVHPKSFLTDAIRIEAARRILNLFETIARETIEPVRPRSRDRRLARCCGTLAFRESAPEIMRGPGQARAPG